MSQTEKKLRGYIWNCQDPECNCCQPVIDEEVRECPSCSDGDMDDWTPTTTLRFWEGIFLSDPSPSEYEALENELAAACGKYGLVKDPQCPGIWRREL